MGKFLIIAGLVLVVAGLLVHFFPSDGLPRLPGDIYIKKENSVFYFPLGWCVLISIVLTLVVRFLGK
ncbi:MAG: DUF2905 domain-containing protein [Gammaproteobacteria bacterium]|nr:DUF2905 family protein [Gammaproteobacteria bacterium]NIN62515.1 DUF2905 family protein [Gammaproteobacteria bacterium]NIO63079.1 DUF2905 family protein [Gammaproteobacteria bacterium]NIP48456.1 DUF2905 domain-containing protein [Gammaproteobacteria bacterium]NIQ08490.1 DUF2905 domain-containing protein [Gammaproteobacteria bacterium]